MICRRRRGITVICTPIMAAAVRPSQTFCIRMKSKAVRACVPNWAGTTMASPMNDPMGSTSSRMIVAVSEDFTSLCASEVKRSINAKS